MRVGIVGYGVVGKALGKLFGYIPAGGTSGKSSRGGTFVYDKLARGVSDAKSREAIQSCDLVFVAVPTPESIDGSADLSAVEEVVGWVEPPMCLKSTVPPGTVDRLIAATGKRICFSPEYVGETAWHPWKEIESHPFVIVGGERGLANLVVRAYQARLGPLVRYYMTDAKTAELCKYMENAFLAVKVAFVNQFYDLAEDYGVNYHELRELWLADERVGRSHTMVTEERGYRGRCLPKDMAAIVRAAREVGGAPLLEAVDRYNDAVCRRADEGKPKSRADRAARGSRK